MLSHRMNIKEVLQLKRKRIEMRLDIGEKQQTSYELNIVGRVAILINRRSVFHERSNTYNLNNID